MEDGNNFGVTVQMMVAKYCKDTREEVRRDELRRYARRCC